MNSSQRHKQYLGFYRRQLGRELDAMGYGQPRETVQRIERQGSNGLSSWLAVAALVLATLSLASTII